VNCLESLAESVVILDSSVEHEEKSVDHKAYPISLVGSPNNLIKTTKQVNFPASSVW